MVELTKMERQVLDAITKDDFYEDGLNSCLWTDVFLDTVKGFYKIDSKTARGVISSLIKKKIINPILFKGRDSSVKLTEYGKTVMREFGYDD